MAGPIRSYWELVEPIFSKVNMGNSIEDFVASIADIPRPVLLLYAAHFCLAEVHNGGFLQFFWNSTGILAPEAAEGFGAIGMPKLSSLLKAAAAPLGSPYPRDRDERWDALLMASGRTTRGLNRIFKNANDFYLAFVDATATLPFESLDQQAWDCANSESGGFQDAATRYAQSLYLVL